MKALSGSCKEAARQALMKRKDFLEWGILTTKNLNVNNWNHMGEKNCEEVNY